MQEKSINLMTIKEASKWASEYLGKDVTASNISYLLQYGKVAQLEHDIAFKIIRKTGYDYADRQ